MRIRWFSAFCILVLTVAALAQDKSAAKVKVAVHVTSREDGKPIAGADVVHVTEDLQEHHTATDAAGVARLEAAEGTFFAKVSHPDWVSGWTGIQSASANDPATFEVPLVRGVLLAGVVVDAKSRRPVPEARVEVDDKSVRDMTGPESRRVGVVRSDDEGRFRLRVPPDRTLHATAAASGFVRSEGRQVVVASAGVTGPVELRLEAEPPSGTLRGSVRSPDGVFVPEASVYVMRADRSLVVADLSDRPDHPKWGDAPGGPVAATNGRFEVRGVVQGGVYVAYATAKGWAPSVGLRRVFVTEAAPTGTVDFTLRRPSSVVIRVLDENGKPTKARGQFLDPDAFAPRDWESDDGGVARLDRVVPGPCRVSAFDFGRNPPTEVPVNVAEGAVASVTVRLEPGASVEGIVVDDADRPVPDLRLDVNTVGEHSDRDFWRSYGSAFTAVDGRFRIDGLCRGAHTVTLDGSTYGPSDLPPFEVPTRDLRLVLPRRGGASLRVTVPSGHSPLTDAALRAETWWMYGNGDRAWSDMPVQAMFREGRVIASDLKPGRWRMRVLADDLASAVLNVEIAPGAVADLGEVRLEALRDVVGRVEDASGAPVQGARVTTGDAVTNWGMSDARETASAPDGSFRLPRMPQGANDIVVQAPDFVDATVHAEVGAHGKPLIVRLARACEVRVAVFDAAGTPIPLARVSIRAGVAKEDGAPVASGQTDFVGVFETRLAPGTYRALVEGSSVQASVKADESKEASVRLVVE